MKLYAYFLRRILYVIPIVLGVCLIIFILFNVVMPDPSITLLGRHANLEQIEDLRRELGLTRPWYFQYFDVVKSAFTFDFGRSWSTKQSIAQMFAVGAIPSLTITIPAFFITISLSIAIALMISFYRGKWIDKTFVVICIGLMSISSLAYILFGQWLFAYKLGLFEISGYESGFPYFIPYIILPIVIWVILSVGPDVRFFRTIILDEVYQDYVRTARAKGLSEKVIFFKHVLKNAMISILTYVIIEIPFLILGALLLESFFGIPGLGRMALEALNSADFPVIRAMTILTAMSYILFNLITDILYTLVDPRIRLK